MRTLSAAVIGCGRMGATTLAQVRSELPPGWLPLNHVEAVLATPGLRLVAVCDRDPAAAERAARMANIDRIFRDHRDLLSELKPDLVMVATRTEGRCGIIADAAIAGALAAHAEKPLCRNLAEAEPAAREVRKRGTAFTWGATRRYMTAYRDAKTILATGDFGALRQVVVKFGRGALQWTHAHSVDIAAYFADDAEVETARATFSKAWAASGNTLDADPTLETGYLQFANGVGAVITAAGGCDIVLACERGEISILEDGAVIETRRLRGAYFRERTTIRPMVLASGLQQALSMLCDSARSGLPCGFGIDRAIALQRVLFALALSGCRGGQAVAPADVPPDFTVTGRQGDRFA